MAEGDTIHRYARRIDAAFAGERLDAATAPAARSPLRLQAERLASLAGRSLERGEARGKHLLLRFEDDLVLHAHLGMSGSWQIVSAGERLRRPPRSAWVLLSAGSATAAQFEGSHLALRTNAELRADRRLRALGPDVLAPEFEVTAGVAALRAVDRERELGEALLDQRILAGIGNIYKAEGCFAARVNPWRRLADLSEAELESVVGEIAALMRVGLETGRQPHDVHRRTGRPCLRCGEPIRSRGQGDANRMTYWCRECQG